MGQQIRSKQVKQYLKNCSKTKQKKKQNKTKNKNSDYYCY